MKVVETESSVFSSEFSVRKEIESLRKILNGIDTPSMVGRTSNVPKCIERLLEIQQHVWFSYMQSPSLENEIRFNCLGRAITISWAVCTTPTHGIDSYFICVKSYIEELLMESEHLYERFNRFWFPSDKMRSLGLRLAVQTLLNTMIEFTTCDKYLLLCYHFLPPCSNLVQGEKYCVNDDVM